MDASSRAALAVVRERLGEITRPASGLLERARDRLTGQERAATPEELAALADELFAVARLLDGQVVGESLADDARRSGTVDRFLAELDGMAAAGDGAVGARKGSR